MASHALRAPSSPVPHTLWPRRLESVLAKLGVATRPGWRGTAGARGRGSVRDAHRNAELDATQWHRSNNKGTKARQGCRLTDRIRL